ncbi:MAG: hypothetical protein JWM57_1385 [Phycisphaerales bacterium]|nr:hypothetical protein [Phycisphaerales bacterium]
MAGLDPCPGGWAICSRSVFRAESHHDGIICGMSAFQLTRDRFLDRTFSAADLADFAEMIGHWYRISVGHRSAARGTMTCETFVFAFAWPRADEIEATLKQGLHETPWELPAADEVRVAGPAVPADSAPDISVWQNALGQPALDDVCVRFRLTVRGPMRGGDGAISFVLCGQPIGDHLLVKAIWQIGQDERWERVCSHAKWPQEPALVAAFDEYVAAAIAQSRDIAAKQAYQSYRRKDRHLFKSGDFERKAMWLTRQMVEVSDESGVVPFLRRLGLPLVGAAVAAGAGLSKSWSSRLNPLAILAAVLLAESVRVMWQKLRKIAKYRLRMRAGLGKLYSRPLDYTIVDLSAERTPTVVEVRSGTRIGRCPACLRLQDGNGNGRLRPESVLHAGLNVDRYRPFA